MENPIRMDDLGVPSFQEIYRQISNPSIFSSTALQQPPKRWNRKFPLSYWDDNPKLTFTCQGAEMSSGDHSWAIQSCASRSENGRRTFQELMAGLLTSKMVEVGEF